MGCLGERAAFLCHWELMPEEHGGGGEGLTSRDSVLLRSQTLTIDSVMGEQVRGDQSLARNSPQFIKSPMLPAVDRPAGPLKKLDCDELSDLVCRARSFSGTSRRAERSTFRLEMSETLRDFLRLRFCCMPGEEEPLGLGLGR